MEDNATTPPQRKEEPSATQVDEAFVKILKTLEPRPAVELSQVETEILELYDRLEGVRLEQAVARAQAAHSEDVNMDEDESLLGAQVERAERDFLDARAHYLLKNSIVDNVIQTDPMVKAVHSGSKASPMERALHPLIDTRDVLSLVQSNLSESLKSVTNSMIDTEAENFAVIRKNQGLFSTLLDLTQRTKDPSIESITDPELKARLVALRRQTTESRRQYRLVKSVVSAIVAGSGVDWAEDEELRELVLDDEENC